MNDVKVKSPSTVDKAAGFGFNPRPRRKSRPVPVDTRSTDELVAEFLAKDKKITKCETRWADGAGRSSGMYDF